MSGDHIDDPRLPETHYRKTRDNSEKAQRLRKNARAYYQKNRERILERQRKYKENPEFRKKRAGYERTYLELNRERVRALDRDPETGKYRWNRYPTDRERTRRNRLKNVYNLTVAEYDTLYQAQEGKCAICRVDILRANCISERHAEKAHIDHCHTTRKVRSLLCQQCNQLLGNARENIEILEKAITYLRGHQNAVCD